MNTKKGISLIVLLITIIIMITLASIIIISLNGNNIIVNATDAKNMSDINAERENATIAVTNASYKKSGNSYTKTDLEKELENGIIDCETTVYVHGKGFVVKYDESNRYYEVNSEGKIEGPSMLRPVEDEYPGDVTDNGKCTGTAEKPYKISSIEDLCAYSNGINAGKYYGKNIILTTDLDFESELSYIDGKIVDIGEIPSCNSTGELMNYLTNRSGTGFVPILYPVSGEAGRIVYFDGQGHKINNIYINSDKLHVGLFGCIAGSISNLEITGEVYGINGKTAGLVGCLGNGTLTISNCTNYCNVTDTNTSMYKGAGGVVGYLGHQVSQVVLNNVKNHGNVNASNPAGGIVGRAFTMRGSLKITNCANYGQIEGVNRDAYGGIGGVVGSLSMQTPVEQEIKISNCYNVGEITGNTTGGIIGYCQMMENTIINIYNCYNLGKITASKYKGKLIGFAGLGIMNISNCYYLKTGEGVKYINAAKAVMLTADNVVPLTQEEITRTNIAMPFYKILNNNIPEGDTELEQWCQTDGRYPEIK